MTLRVPASTSEMFDGFHVVPLSELCWIRYSDVPLAVPEPVPTSVTAPHFRWMLVVVLSPATKMDGGFVGFGGGTEVDGIGYNLLYSKNAILGGGGFNISGYINPKMDALLDKKLREAHDEFRPADYYLEKWGYKDRVDRTGALPTKP